MDNPGIAILDQHAGLPNNQHCFPPSIPPLYAISTGWRCPSPHGFSLCLGLSARPLFLVLLAGAVPMCNPASWSDCIFQHRWSWNLDGLCPHGRETRVSLASRLGEMQRASTAVCTGGLTGSHSGGHDVLSTLNAAERGDLRKGDDGNGHRIVARWFIGILWPCRRLTLVKAYT
jgi:hypothetical protein